jgi:hypothetical protein
MKEFEFIKAAKFFPVYAPNVKNYNQKLSGKNTRGNPLDFTLQDKKEIKAGMKRLFKDLENM